MVQGDARRFSIFIAGLLLINVLLQMFQDINCGVDGPLYASIFDRKRLGRVMACKNFAVCVMTFGMLWYGLSLADQNEIFPYLISAALLLVSLLIAIFIIRAPTETHP